MSEHTAEKDAYGDECVWDNTNPSRPQQVLHKGDVGDEALWAAIVRLVKNGEVV